MFIIHAFKLIWLIHPVNIFAQECWKPLMLGDANLGKAKTKQLLEGLHIFEKLVTSNMMISFLSISGLSGMMFW